MHGLVGAVAIYNLYEAIEVSAGCNGKVFKAVQMCIFLHNNVTDRDALHFNYCS